MQIGRLEMIDQAQVEHVEKTSKIQETDSKVKVDPDDQYKNAQAQVKEENNEVILDNVKFGYNSETNDFFVRIKTKSGEYQLPTEDMLKIKQSLMEAYKETQES